VNPGGISPLQDLSLPDLILFIVMSACAVVGLSVLLYVVARAALDLREERNSRRSDRELWLSEQARIHRETK
jgi:phage shock protein PspC (stress-responsive transcriptional regulator)